MTIDHFIQKYPKLYHMAEAGSWPSIQTRGLLSTTATLDLANLAMKARFKIESMHRPAKIVVPIDDTDPICIRDQKPMSETKLQKCLLKEITPRQWYEYLNRKVFFWATEARLTTLLQAKDYSNLEHDVLTINTTSMVAAHGSRILLCHMNSGNTSPRAAPRGFSSFCRIEDYASKRNGNPVKEVAEVVIDYKVADIAVHVTNVRRMRGTSVIADNIG